MKDTISMIELRRDLFKLFAVFKNGGSFKVSHRRHIYVFSFSPTGEKVTTPYKRSSTNAMNKIDPNSVSSGLCATCGDITLNGVCMAKPPHE
jgi:hypothetical protein